MKFVILDNTGWTMHFYALQSISRAAETASAVSRRASEHLVRWTLRSSSRRLHFFVHTPPHPYTFERSCAMTRDARRYKFFSHPRRYPYAARRQKYDARRYPIVHVRCHILSVAETTTPACRGRRALPNGDRCARHANQNVSQSSPPAVAATGADAVTGLRADGAIAVRFAGASRSSRAGAGADVAVDTGAGIARGA